MDKEIERMQEVSLLVRRAVGWTAEEFGEKIGVTRQTISNIEKQRSNLTKTQYLAMRYVLAAEIISNQDDTKMLKYVLDAFVDHPENYSEEQRGNIISKANMLAPAILAGASTRKAVSDEWVSIEKNLGAITEVAADILIGLGIGTIISGIFDAFKGNK